MKIHKEELHEITVGGLTLQGYSVAGEETVIIAKELDAVFDVGKCPRQALNVGHVLLSHGHIDHAAGLQYYFAQRSFRDDLIGTALVPFEIAPLLEELMECWGKIDGQIPPHRIVGLKHGDLFELNNRLSVQVFSTNHVVPSLGFSIVEMRHKLREEFHGMRETQLVNFKRQGVSITNVEQLPIVAYLGDTAFADYSSLSYVTRAKILLVECTFFRPDYIGRTERYKHIHVRDLPKLLAQVEAEHIIIVHVSKAIKLAEADEILKQYLSADILQRVSFLMG